MASPLAGAWELVSDMRDGIIILTDSHYSWVMSSKIRTPWKGNEPTGDEALEGLASMSALGGAYSVSGSEIVCQRDTNSKVDVAGKPISFEFSVNEGELKLIPISGAPSPGSRGSQGTGNEMLFRRSS